MIPDLTHFGRFNPQKPLSPAFPDHMREIGYQSTGGYPIEQAPWMAGPPIPDFMALGSWDHSKRSMQTYYTTENGLSRNRKTGLVEIFNQKGEYPKTSSSFPPYFSNVNTYNSLGGENSNPLETEGPKKLSQSKKEGNRFKLLGNVVFFAGISIYSLFLLSSFVGGDRIRYSSHNDDDYFYDDD